MNVDGGVESAEADQVVEVVDVVRVPVVLAAGAEKGVLDANLLVFLAGPTQFLVDVASRYQGTIGVVHLVPIQRYRAEFLFLSDLKPVRRWSIFHSCLDYEDFVCPRKSQL